MSNVSREKIALVVFVGLIAVSLCGLIGYLAIGHSWNVAASNIDDAAGRMDGYTAIVFKGTVDPEAAEKNGSGTKSGKGETGESDTAEEIADDVESGLSGLERSKKATDASGADGLGSDRKPISSDPLSDDGDGEDAADPEESGRRHAAGGDGLKDDARADSDSTGSNPNPGLGSSGSSSAAKKKIPIDITEVEQSYLDKNATVFTIDSENLGKYLEGTILKKGDHRFGIFSVTPRMTKKAIEQQVEYFEKYNVDFIVALTPDKEILEDVAGIDIVISTQDEGLFVMGETINGTFYVNAPQLGSAGIILISPSNVVSAKVMQSS